MRTYHYHKLPHPMVYILSFLLMFQCISASAAWPKRCGDNQYKTEILNVEEDGDCYVYEIKVSFDGRCSYELSHYNLDLGCGTITEASNSEGWKMELNSTDPTTGLSGLKVDDIQSFGKHDKFKSFTVQFTFCPDDACEANANCISPIVAYKAGKCVYRDTIEMSCQKPLNVNVEKNDPTCADGNDGSIDLNINGGTPPYSIAWNTGATDSTLQNLTTGDYTFTLTDDAGETIEQTVALTAPTPIEITGSTTDPTCRGVNSGAIDINVSGGTEPYTISWSNGASTSSVDSLSAGMYIATVTDANGCMTSASYTLENTTSIVVTPEVTQPSCDGSVLGSINLTVSGGEPPYTYSWSTGETSETLDELSDGYYTVTVQDAQGCEAIKTISIETQTSIELSATVTQTNCFNDPEGSIDLSVTGGTEPYSYDWSNGETTQDIDGLTAGKYSVTVTDANGCQAEYSANVRLTELLIHPMNITSPSCGDETGGAIDIIVFHGEEPYTYEWSNGETTEDISDVSAGEYTVTVTDANGCSATKTIVIPESNTFQIQYEVFTNGCTSDDNDIIVNVSGGDGNYEYEWSNGETTKDLIGVPEGTYDLTVTDGSGCSQTISINVENNDTDLSCLIENNNTELVCNSTGNILTSSADGAIKYQWEVSSSDGSWDITSSTEADQIEFITGNSGTSATFHLTVTYENGCTASCSITLDACTTDDNPDDGDDDTGDDDGDNDDGSDDDGDNDDGDDSDDGDDGDDKNKSCDDCFFTDPITINKSDGSFNYTVTVNSNGDCNYDLSHLVIQIPECAEIVDYSNNMGWAMEIVDPDPKTGLSGIKVDDIPSFGKDPSFTSFTVSFSLSADNKYCFKKLYDLTPKIAYKAGKCVQYEHIDNFEEDEKISFKTSLYPNPTRDKFTVELDDHFISDIYTVEVFDNVGNRIKCEKIDPRYDRTVSFDISEYKGHLYFMKIIGPDGTKKVHKVLKQ